ncbi:hypothetical protein HYC85_017324 [Camellia sinensis]|uniref:Uncharacterized protein n=1 Tax=Camellia sinensis TaxID=4442 RepID=A0A7J7H5Q3_CAMSI|nr:hypothetical protein HYC85_017324 [Camellia sinensis]
MQWWWRLAKVVQPIAFNKIHGQLTQINYLIKGINLRVITCALFLFVPIHLSDLKLVWASVHINQGGQCTTPLKQFWGFKFNMRRIIIETTSTVFGESASWVPGRLRN